MLKLIKEFKGKKNVAFLVVQTVFEGFGTNTAKRAARTAKRYSLTIPVGHDAGQNNTGSRVMKRYRSRGTPWFVIIDKKGVVRYNGFHLSVQGAIRFVEQLRKAK